MLQEYTRNDQQRTLPQEWVNRQIFYENSSQSIRGSRFSWMRSCTTGWTAEKMIYFVTAHAKVSTSTPEEIQTPSSMLKNIRSTFNLSISDAAKVLDVTRPTLYRWATFSVASDIEKIRSKKEIRRLKKINAVAEYWKSLEHIPGRWLNVSLSSISDRSVLDLLLSEDIDFELFKSAHRILLQNKKLFIQAENDLAKKAVATLKESFSALDQ